MAIDPHDRLILALDLPSADDAKRLIDRLGATISFVKIGLELFTRGGPEIVRWAIRNDKRVFLDLKLLDIGETVKRATAAAAELGVAFLTVHAGSKSLQAAVEGRGQSPMKILAVTVLTSFTEADLQETGVSESMADAVLRRARLAVSCKADGVVASGMHTGLIRKEAGSGLLIATPGIRPEGSAPDDQMHAVTPSEALAAGSDYLIVGRPIRDAADPVAAARAIQAQIGSASAMRELM